MGAIRVIAMESMLEGLNLGGMKIRRKDESGIQESMKLNPAVLQAAMGGSFMKGADGEDAHITAEALQGVKMMEGRDKMEMFKSMQRQDEVIADVDEVRGRGNDLFRAGDYLGAEGLYREAMQVVTQHMAQQVAVEDATYGPKDPCKPEAPNTDPKMQQELLNKQVACWLNVAMCNLRTEDYQAVILSCDAAITLKPEQTQHAKALFRRGQAAHKLKQFEQAKRDYKSALEKEPTDSKIVQALKAVRAEQAEATTEDEKAMAALFKTGSLYRGVDGKWKYPRVYFDFAIDIKDLKDENGKEIELGRVTFELFVDRAPKTCENFRALCTGEKGVGAVHGKPLHYLNTKILRVQQGMSIEGGDIVNNDGTEGESIYGGYFEDENYAIRHDDTGILTSVNKGPGTNQSQWAVLLCPAPWCDRRYVAFGRVLSGMTIFRDLEEWPREDGLLMTTVYVKDCGELDPM